MPDIRHRLTILISALAICALWPGESAAQHGFYLSGKVGAVFAPSLEITGSSDDRASVYDELINPLYATVTQTAGYEDYNCTGPNRGQGDDWRNAFDPARGLLTGAAAGYQTGSLFRFELEYFYQDINYNQTSDVPGAGGASGDKLNQEIQSATDRIGNVNSHNLFGNLLVDLTTNTRLSPYVGFGVGVSASKTTPGGLSGRAIPLPSPPISSGPTSSCSRAPDRPWITTVTALLERSSAQVIVSHSGRPATP